MTMHLLLVKFVAWGKFHHKEIHGAPTRHANMTHYTQRRPCSPKAIRQDPARDLTSLMHPHDQPDSTRHRSCTPTTDPTAPRVARAPSRHDRTASMSLVRPTDDLVYAWKHPASLVRPQLAKAMLVKAVASLMSGIDATKGTKVSKQDVTVNPQDVTATTHAAPLHSTHGSTPSQLHCRPPLIATLIVHRATHDLTPLPTSSLPQLTSLCARW